MHVGRNRHIHHLRVGQFQIVHQVDIFVDRFDLEARVEQLLFANRRNGVALIVMCRIDQRLVRQLEQLVEDGIVLRARVAILEIGAAGAADQQSIAREDTVIQQIGVRIVSMAGCVEHIEAQTLDVDAVAFRHAHRDDIGMGLLAHHRDAMGAVAQRTQSRDMVGMQMRIDGLHELEIELTNEL
jgi:hypothetical protein